MSEDEKMLTTRSGRPVRTRNSRYGVGGSQNSVKRHGLRSATRRRESELMETDQDASPEFESPEETPPLASSPIREPPMLQSAPPSPKVKEVEVPPTPPKPFKRKPGRPKGSTNKRKKKENGRMEPKVLERIMMESNEEDERPSIVEENDEIIDLRGEKKITKNGELLGGRQFKLPTFQLATRDDSWFVLSMDAAKLLGYRDSYLFFLRNPSLKRMYTTEEEREWLIGDAILAPHFRTRQVALVSARSIFKLFGAKVIKGGRRRRDDYFESGVPEMLEAEDAGSANEPTEELPRRTGGMSSFASRTQDNEIRWMHQCAMSMSEFNHQLRMRRRQHPTYHDPHTNLEQLHQATQPTRVRVEQLNRSPPQIADEPTQLDPVIRFETRPINSLGELKDEVLEVLPPDIKAVVDEVKKRAEFPDVGDARKSLPLALMDGQRQWSYAVHSMRFGQPSSIVPFSDVRSRFGSTYPQATVSTPSYSYGGVPGMFASPRGYTSTSTVVASQHVTTRTSYTPIQPAPSNTPIRSTNMSEMTFVNASPANFNSS